MAAPKKIKSEDKKVKPEKPAPAPTPEKVKPKPKVKEETPKPKRTPSKTPVAVPVFHRLTAEASEGAIPVDVDCNDSTIAAQDKKGDYTKVLHMRSGQGFEVVKTIIMPDGDNKGYQAILIKPAKAFDFAALEPVVRARIYGFYFACKGIVGEPIVFDGKRENKEPYAKTFCNGSKARVALLAINQQTHKEAKPILYAKPFKFDSTSTLIDFLLGFPDARPLLRDLEIKQFKKADGRNALHSLSGAKHITRLHIDSGLVTESDVKKAAKSFHGDAYKFLQAIGGAKGVDVLSFGKDALTAKNDKKESKPWPAEKVQEFKDELRKKLDWKMDTSIYNYFDEAD